MTLALAYLVQRFFYRIVEFLRHWYVKSVRIYLHFIMEMLQKIDYGLAWKITLKNLFQPLYKDYSIISYILGFIFRLGRLFIATVVYIIIFFFAVAFYVLWLIIPPFLIYKSFI